jgi:ligand-binding sensor domain-containing protein
VDTENRIWFADSRNGLGLFNPNDNSFTFYNSGIIDRNVSKVLAASDGKIWLGFGNQSYAEAAYFDGTNFINFTEADGFTPKTTREIVEGPNGEIWYACSNGIAKYQNGTWNSYTIEDNNIPLTEIRTIAVDNSGTAWFGGSQQVGIDTLKIFNFDGTNFTEHTLDFTANSDVNYMTFDRNGNLWISTGNAIVVYNPKGDVIIKVKNEPSMPEGFVLKQNYPNPFNPTTTISYSIPAVIATQTYRGKQSVVNVTLTVYNTLGQKIATLVNKEQAPGNYTVQFNASNLPSGVYYYRLQTGVFTQSRKMIVLK